MKKYIDDFKVIKNERLNNEYVILTLKHPAELPEMLPGQFVEVRVDNGPNTFLRRPISIHDADPDNNTMKLLVQEIGEGTRLMGQLKEGDICNLVYPLGNSFSLPDKPRVLLVGGGCGIAPLLLMGRHLKANGIEPRFLLGARSAEGLIALEDFRSVGEVFTTTEDGSEGTKGYVIHHPIMRNHEPEIDMIYTCGPEAMMKVVAKYAKNHGIKCEVSLENHMACGFGACLCCVADTLDGHKCTCTDGPVFDSTYLKW
ncbi:MAG: dihydroorotate dehydrogenase electron transfer subunit [Carboxylicivirga sp.]|jgi:dihydroorotate dehydrogenase electron transfer subunit|nr:dihydroorotate dehydrogenase electron transfer subunit [Carboxylicivirga sp.]